MKHFFTLIAAAMTFMVSGWSQTNTVVDVIVNSPDHNTLETAVLAAGLEGDLSGTGPFTVFAPTDSAFAAVDSATLAGILADDALLTAVLTYHVHGGEALAAGLMDQMMVSTLNGQELTVTLTDSATFINNAMVTFADIPADNGVVHVIDAVLVPTLPPPPPTTVVDIIVDSEDHDTLELAVLAADLAGTLSGDGPFTVFAPTDDAFAAIDSATLAAVLADIETLTSILTLHVHGGNVLEADLMDQMMVPTLNGEELTISLTDSGAYVNNALITVTDLVADNGVVHVIDAVLLPAPPPPPLGTVVDIIVDSPDHETLEAAVIAADLAGTLSGEGPFTVFAPTDDAFAAVDSALLAAVLADIPTLTAILTYHVHGGNALSTDLMDGMEVSTLNGAPVTVTINEEGTFINDAKVIVADLIGSNGVVHVIDAVLLPPTPDSIDEVVANWAVMPNPAKDVFTLTGVAPTARIAMIDLTGRTVREFAQGTTVLSVGDMPRGTYLLTITEGRNIQTKKVMMQ